MFNTIILLNFIYALISGVISMGLMGFAFWLFNKKTSFSLNTQLRDGNIAVALVLLGIFIGIGITTGLTIGLAVN